MLNILHAKEELQDKKDEVEAFFKRYF
jgi:hypothetical protein